MVAALLGLWLAVAVPGHHLDKHSPLAHNAFVPAISHRWAAARFHALTRLQSVESAGSSATAGAPGPASRSGRASGAAQPATAASHPAGASTYWLVTVVCVIAIMAALGAAGMTAFGIRMAK